MSNSPLRKDEEVDEGLGEESSSPSLLSQTVHNEVMMVLKGLFKWIPRPGRISWHGFLAIKLMALAFLWGVAGKAIVEIFNYGWHLVSW